MEYTNKIIHIDMDAFFASVEQRDFPDLKGKPVAVGGDGERGVVAAASYEARKYGVFSAMSSRLAKKKCPDLIFTKPRFEVYKEVSNQIRNIFFEYTDLVEPLSLDEAYLDVTENHKGINSAILVAKEIKTAIFKITGLTASAGISYNKFLAKTASALKKPDGLTLIHPDKAEDFIGKLPIEKFHGIGAVTANKMKRLLIFNGADLRKQKLETLTSNFGKAGRHYFYISRGVDNRIVNPNRVRKSIGAENTFSTDLFLYEDIKNALFQILDKAESRVEKAGVFPKTITLKVKFNNFEIVTRSKTRIVPIVIKKDSIEILKDFLIEFCPPEKGIRLLGVSFSNFISKKAQLTIDF